MHGPTFPSVIPIIETGIAALERGGFGDRTGVAYSALLNTAMLTISIGDERLLHEEDGPRDHATMMAEFRRAAADSPGFSMLAQEMISPFVRGGEEAAERRRAYYDTVVEITIAGLERLRR
jgi:hypothetical protein